MEDNSELFDVVRYKGELCDLDKILNNNLWSSKKASERYLTFDDRQIENQLWNQIKFHWIYELQRGRKLEKTNSEPKSEDSIERLRWARNDIGQSDMRRTVG